MNMILNQGKDLILELLFSSVILLINNVHGKIVYIYIYISFMIIYDTVTPNLNKFNYIHTYIHKLYFLSNFRVACNTINISS